MFRKTWLIRIILKWSSFA